MTPTSSAELTIRFYVRPEHRGRGVVAAIVAEICAQVRAAGGEFLHGGGNREVEEL